VLFWNLWLFWWGFEGFDEVNFYSVSSSLVYRVFCGYMKSAVLLQEGAVSAFGVGFCWRVLQEGQQCAVTAFGEGFIAECYRRDSSVL
jgi:hypothetical protein